MSRCGREPPQRADDETLADAASRLIHAYRRFIDADGRANNVNYLLTDVAEGPTKAFDVFTLALRRRAMANAAG
jgi:hypothetical protein